METFDVAFNSWLEPAGIATSGEVVTARKTVALSLPDSAVSDYDLVLGAFGQLGDEPRTAIEEQLQQQDPTHTPGKRNLVELICASALMSAMEKADGQAVNIALLIGSALFRNMKPRLKQLEEASARVVQAETSRSRQRMASKKVTRPQTDAEAPVDQAAIAALSSRLERAIAHFDTQLQLINEEVDILWWARSARSASGEEWSALSDLERAMRATAEVSELVVDYPVTGAVFEVLRGVADGPKRRAESLGAISNLAALQVQWPSIDESIWLLPVLSAIRIARTYPEATREGVISAELGINDDEKFRIVDLPEQMLRELAIVKRMF